MHPFATLSHQDRDMATRQAIRRALLEKTSRAGVVFDVKRDQELVREISSSQRLSQQAVARELVGLRLRAAERMVKGGANGKPELSAGVYSLVLAGRDVLLRQRGNEEEALQRRYDQEEQEILEDFTQALDEVFDIEDAEGLAQEHSEAEYKRV